MRANTKTKPRNRPAPKGQAEEPTLPVLSINQGNLPETAYALRDLLAASPSLFERAGAVRLAIDEASGLPTVHALNAPRVVMEAHRVCQPVRRKPPDFDPTNATLPDRVASMYLAMNGERRLRVLDGITTAPVLASNGEVVKRAGYDPKTRLWCVRVPALNLAARPTRPDAEAALCRIRYRFRTFPFADAITINDPTLGLPVVDLSRGPGADESAMLAGLLTAVCRASLGLAPGLIFTAALVSGAGTGKGLIARAICQIAFGIAPHAVTTGGDRAEFDKRLTAELIQANPALFLDNVNGVALQSDQLASAMTEHPARVRVLGKSECSATIRVRGARQSG